MEDPLNINIPLAGVETDFPLLPEGDYPFQIAESVLEPNKDKTGHNWKLTLALASPAVGIDGRDVKVNTKVFHLMACQAKADSNDPDAFRRGLCEAVDAIFATDKSNRPPINRQTISDSVGKMVTAHIFVDEYQGRKSNKVKRLKKAA